LFVLLFTLNFPLTDPQKLTFQAASIYDCLVIRETRTRSSGVASPKYWEGPKNFGGPKCLILGE